MHFQTLFPPRTNIFINIATKQHNTTQHLQTLSIQTANFRHLESTHELFSYFYRRSIAVRSKILRKDLPALFYRSTMEVSPELVSTHETPPSLREKGGWSNTSGDEWASSTTLRGAEGVYRLAPHGLTKFTIVFSANRYSSSAGLRSLRMCPVVWRVTGI